MTSQLLDRARSGDEQAFDQLTVPFRRELHVHCYRMLGSAQDAEDVLQETLLAAWQGLSRFEERASVRTWLYRIATNRCLNALRAASRRPHVETPFPGLPLPQPTREGDVPWLEPYPDFFLAELTDGSPGPDARYEATEAISLAFITALQTLPPRQRAVLILRDVLGFQASQAARMLGVTEDSVTSALKRARDTVDRKASGTGEPAPRPGSAAEQNLVARLTRAYEASDLDGLIALLRDDVWLRMPPLPLEYHGRDLAARFFTVVAFRAGNRFRLIPTRANLQPALGIYTSDLPTGDFHAGGILVLTLAGDRIAVMTRFDNSVLPQFGLPCALTS